jgi:hypothetical protein
MRQSHRAGEKMFVDFSGDGLELVDPKTGEVTTAKLFVAVLGASNLTYAEPVLSEDLPTWTGCHVRALDYFGGVERERAFRWHAGHAFRGVSHFRFPPGLRVTGNGNGKRHLVDHFSGGRSWRGLASFVAAGPRRARPWRRAYGALRDSLAAPAVPGATTQQLGFREGPCISRSAGTRARPCGRGHWP